MQVGELKDLFWQHDMGELGPRMHADGVTDIIGAIGHRLFGAQGFGLTNPICTVAGIVIIAGAIDHFGSAEPGNRLSEVGAITIPHQSRVLHTKHEGAAILTRFLKALDQRRDRVQRGELVQNEPDRPAGFSFLAEQ